MKILNGLLDDMDIPQTRRDLSKNENVRWLLRNLAIRNKNHPKFKIVMDELVILSVDKNPLIIK
tara:strand:- start:170 stop:361 length:192 start_codon:yes stop_codon:yes gene_type:complete